MVNSDGLETLVDEKRIEWKVTLDEYKDLQLVNQQRLNAHVCDDHDYKEFFPIVKANVDLLARLKK